MPPFDENGGIINLDAPFFIRGDDAKEYILPGSIPTLGETCVADPEEHDCLPPLDDTATWQLSDNFAKKLLETMDKLEAMNADSIKTVVVQTAHDMTEKLFEAGVLASPIHVEHNNKTREWRRAIRWNERNRRRRLKGKPEKRNPYPRAVAFTYVVNLNPTGPIDMRFEWEGNDESED